MSNKLKIGVFGYGVVGSGLAHVLKNSKGLDASIVKVCVKDAAKQRDIDPEVLTLNPEDILNDPEINVVAELIDDADVAYQIVKAAMQNGKHVVSANKKMLAYHIEELIQLQWQYKVSFLYEASACGSIPIIRNLEEYYDNDLLQSVSGILNGSSNYILTKIFNENLDYHLALKEAQDLGFAESDPTSDVGGFDTLYKLIILTVHGFGLFVHPDEVFNSGIANLSPKDIELASQKGYKIRLLGKVTKVNGNRVNLFVAPKFVRPTEHAYTVESHYNGVLIQGNFYDNQFMYGKGAGAHPTGSAVLSDITALAYNYKYEYKKLKYYGGLEYTNDMDVEIYLRYTDKNDLELFDFKEISESLTGKDFNYVIGTLNLSKLINIRKQIAGKDIFLAYLGDE
ncbi:homoserine dehydrogenase [Labilibaculum sp. A4]|uniref:homoserine dehydrogenase n=1 Tax=Labilibaculum euxinus TaxID=2686357 RepID=UPI000F61966D|nr:homoserine dehydrogenase [Labilibaculum euxinus]MDQ1772130.1 homoserine dehydrogenase [Labilibaculum euxinus]MWN77833.1 homoserine dehydrogenase [Labilibaculum euxinus]